MSHFKGKSLKIQPVGKPWFNKWSYQIISKVLPINYIENFFLGFMWKFQKWLFWAHWKVTLQSKTVSLVASKCSFLKLPNKKNLKNASLIYNLSGHLNPSFFYLVCKSTLNYSEQDFFPWASMCNLMTTCLCFYLGTYFYVHTSTYQS